MEFFVPTEYEAVSWEIAVNGVAARPAKAEALQQQHAKKQQGADNHAQEPERRPNWVRRMGAAVSRSPSLAPQSQSEEVKEDEADARSTFLQTQRQQSKLTEVPSELPLDPPKEKATSSLRGQLKAAKSGSRSRSKQPKQAKDAPNDGGDAKAQPTGYPTMPVPNEPKEKPAMSLREQLKAAKSNSRNRPLKSKASGGAQSYASAAAATADPGESSLSRSTKLRQAVAVGEKATSSASSTTAERTKEVTTDSNMSRSSDVGGDSKEVATEVAATLRTVRALVRQANFGVSRANRRLDDSRGSRSRSSSSGNSSDANKSSLNTTELSVLDRQAAVIARQKALKKYNTAVVEAKRIQALAPKLSFQGCV